MTLQRCTYNPPTPTPPSQIGPNQRTLDVPQYCGIQIFKNLDEIQLFPMSALNSDCLSKGFFERFSCAWGFLNMLHLLVQVQTNHQIWSYSRLICIFFFCSIMCQSASRRHREVSLISSATRCCQLQSTPWRCKGENKPKCCLLIRWDGSTARSFWSIPVTFLWKALNQGKYYNYLDLIFL